MSDRSFSRRRRGMRFRPSGGLGHGQQRPDREANQARAEAVGGLDAQEKVYDHRHIGEIERAENLAAGSVRGALVGCGGGALELLEVQLEGRKRMPASEFLRGQRIAEGEALG